MEEEAAPEAGSKEETDARSVFVNNVDFGTTPEELQQLFAGCGTVNRVTILADKFGTPKVSCQHTVAALGLHKHSSGIVFHAVCSRSGGVCKQRYRNLCAGLADSSATPPTCDRWHTRCWGFRELYIWLHEQVAAP